MLHACPEFARPGRQGYRLESRMTEPPVVDLAELRRIAPEEVRLLWVNDWYDGPIEAVVEHEGQRCLMVLHDRRALGDDEQPFRWLLVKLTREEQAEEERWHALFVQHVGDHWCMHAEPHAPATGPRDAELFYRPFRARPPRDLAAAEVLGWLDEIPKA
jgi:hypothetical protein